MLRDGRRLTGVDATPLQRDFAGMVRITNIQGLRTLIASNPDESPTLEFKKEIEGYVPDQPLKIDQYELAKDVAAFANGMGGEIVVGVDQKRGDYPVKAYPIDVDALRALANEYDNARRDKCRPMPDVTSDLIAIPEHDGLGVLVVHVQPYIAGLVGARGRHFNADDREHKFPAYLFPIRTGSRATDLGPEQFPLYMNPQIRRWIVLLDQIESEQADPKKQVKLRLVTRDGPTISPARLSVDPAGNVLTIYGRLVGETTDGSATIPLDGIASIWRGAIDNWTIQIDGGLAGGLGHGNAKLGYVPWNGHDIIASAVRSLAVGTSG